MIFLAYLVSNTWDGDSIEITALGTTRAEAVDLVMDAWHTYASHHHLNPNAAHEEDVAVVAGHVGDSWVNGDKQA